MVFGKFGWFSGKKINHGLDYHRHYGQDQDKIALRILHKILTKLKLFKQEGNMTRLSFSPNLFKFFFFFSERMLMSLKFFLCYKDLTVPYTISLQKLCWIFYQKLLYFTNHLDSSIRVTRNKIKMSCKCCYHIILSYEAFKNRKDSSRINFKIFFEYFQFYRIQMVASSSLAYWSFCYNIVFRENI